MKRHIFLIGYALNKWWLLFFIIIIIIIIKGREEQSNEGRKDERRTKGEREREEGAILARKTRGKKQGKQRGNKWKKKEMSMDISFVSNSESRSVVLCIAKFVEWV